MIVDGPSEELVRQQWAVYHDTVRRLGAEGGLTIAGADLVRRDLRPGGIWTEQTTPVGFGEQRILLLHDVTMALAELRGPGFEEYYRGAGDLLPEIPDDAAELEA